MKNLKKLYLYKNEIENINIFGKKYINIRKITDLELSYNNISNINVLKRMCLENLKTLYLNNNKIKNIKPLETAYFPKLRKLDISQNLAEISLQKNIDILENCTINIRPQCSMKSDFDDFINLSSESEN